MDDDYYHDKPEPAATFACVSLNMTDRLRLIGFPPLIIDSIREAINSSWPKGIQSERDYYGSYEYKLNGNPWSGQFGEAVPSRVMMTTVLSTLYHSGWHLQMSTDISKKVHDKDTLFFRSGPLPSPASFFSASFNEGDKLRLIGAPPNVINSVKQVLAGAVQSEEWKAKDIAYQFKLHGYPWHSNGADTVVTRVLLMNILNALNSFGWEIHATIDMSQGHESSTQHSSGGGDTDSWFFRKLQ